MDQYTILKEYFGYDQFKYPQDEIIQMVLNGHEVIGLLPTGFGKSIIFQVLALLLDGVSIIISPLIALMEDQVNKLKKKGIKAEVLNSNLSFEEQDKINSKLYQYKMLYVSPERLANLQFLKNIEKVKISMIVVDEAHTILWADGFRSAFRNIHTFIKNLPIRPRILALTATATSRTVQIIKEYLHMHCPILVEVPMDRPNLFYKVVQIENKLSYLIKYLNIHKQSRGIIYCLTRKTVENLHQKLVSLGYLNSFYHGGLDIEVKSKNQELFTNRDCNLMICTNAFGMGIDIPDIRFVIEYDLPQSLEDLVQQLGRASRDGAYGEGVVFFSFKDLDTISYFIEQQKEPKIRKQYQKNLDGLVDYCLTSQCRHQFISSYFGFKKKKCRCRCDNCLKKSR